MVLVISGEACQYTIIAQPLSELDKPLDQILHDGATLEEANVLAISKLVREGWDTCRTFS